MEEGSSSSEPSRPAAAEAGFLVHQTQDPNPLVLALCDGTIYGRVSLDVHSEDEMWRLFYYRLGEDRDRALAMYAQSGFLIWSTLKRLIEHRFGEIGRVGKLLDFASGYGRVTRFIVEDLPPDRVWIADIYAGGVAFQQERFGVQGIVSTADPADLIIEERFDVILVSSLFSHLPEETFHSWLRRLCGLLAPGGMLIFSVHDQSLLPPGREMPPGGLLFDEMSESASLAKAQYGTTWVSESFVRAAAASAAPGCSVARILRGFGNFQDLYVLINEADVDLSELPRLGQGGIEGFVEHCSRLSPDLAAAAGWVADRVTGEPVQEVRAEIDGRVVQRRRDGELEPRGDISPALFPNERVQALGWRLFIQLPPGVEPASAVLTIVVVGADGRETVLLNSTLQAAFLRSVRLDLYQLHKQLEDTRTRFEQQQAWAGYELSVRDARIAAMEASRFWKLRNAWFAFKRLLGFGD